MPATVRLRLLLDAATDLAPHHAPGQGWFLALVDRIHPPWAAQLHPAPNQPAPGRDDLRPYTLAPLFWPYHDRLADDDGFWLGSRCLAAPDPDGPGRIALYAGQVVALRVGFAHDADAARFCAGLALHQNALPRLGHAPCSLLRLPVFSEPGDDPDPDICFIPWEGLPRAAPPAWAIDIAFVTPTHFSRHHRDLATCAATALLGHWQETWRYFAPPDSLLPVADILDFADRAHLLPPDTDAPLRPATVRLKGGVRHGWEGFRRLVWEPGTPEPVRQAGATLALWASFRGTGGHTTLGLGQTRVQFWEG